MASILNADDINVKYISRPGAGGGEGGILTFSTGGSADEVDQALLVETAQIQFARAVSRKFFINLNGVAYIVGLGTGTLTVRGLLGSAQQFTNLFGTDLNDLCKMSRTATLETAGMQSCDDGSEFASGSFVMSGVIPQSVTITTTIAENGTLYYSADASFLISGLRSGD